MVVCGDPISCGGHVGAVATGAPDDQALQECRGLAKKVVMLATKMHATAIAETFAQLGFAYVTLDLQWLRSGSMDVALSSEKRKSAKALKQ